jgi:2-polyprenyl-6-methoxyphenol hydroxylase-like FAD-dependent oxidoreductase
VILEKSSSISTEGAAITLWNNGLQALARLKLRPDCSRILQPLQVLRLVSHQGRPLGTVPVARLTNQFGPGAAMVYRPELAAVLAENVRPEQVQLSSEVVDVDEDANSIADGRRVSGDLLIGADGGRGTTRQLFAPSEPVYCKHVAWRGTTHFEHPFFRPGESFSFLGRGAYIVVHHLTNGRFYWIGTRRSEEPRRIDPARRKIEAQEWFSSWFEPVRTLIDQTPEAGIIVNDIFACHGPNYAVRPRSVLLGDAAHLSAPQLGQGAALALEDAVQLAGCLREDRWPAAGTRFEQLRQARAARVVLKSLAVANAYHRNTLPEVWLRNAVLKASPAGMLLRRAGWAARTELVEL